MFSVDTVLSEKLPAFTKKHPVISRSLGSVLKYLLHEFEFRQFEARCPYLEGFDFVEQVLEYFAFDYRVFDRDIGRIPQTGRVVMVANHPIGSLDGLALLKMMGEYRKDVKVVANDMLYAIKPLKSLLLPVNNLGNRTPKDHIKAIHTHLKSEGAVIIFPAGEVSRMSPSGIKDGVWDKGFLRFAKATQSPVLPLHVNGRNSIFFYALSILSKPLSGLWLIREMFKQASQHVDVRVGHAVYPEQIEALGLTIQAEAKLFRKIVYKLGRGKGMLGFEPEVASVAMPESRQGLLQEINQCERLGETHDNKKILLYRYKTNSLIMREIGRLREMTFRAVKEGSGKQRDLDEFDHYYDHVVLWDSDQLEIVGAYRMVQVQRALMHQKNQVGINNVSLYTQTLFDYEVEAAPASIQQGLELGRSFVQPNYWGKRSLDYLWFGIGAYLKKYPEIKALFGPVSISASFTAFSTDALVYFFSTYCGSPSSWTLAKNAHRIDAQNMKVLEETFSGIKAYSEAFIKLKGLLASQGEQVPTLYKQYVEVAETGGTQFVAFTIDQAFSDCVDGLVCVDVSQIKAKKRQRYMR